LREYFFRLSKKESLPQAAREYSLFFSQRREGLPAEGRHKEKSYKLCGLPAVGRLCAFASLFFLLTKNGSLSAAADR
jgi:hypothetical protein